MADHRPFYACMDCDVVYARLQAPGTCRVCGGDQFEEVYPQEEPF